MILLGEKTVDYRIGDTPVLKKYIGDEMVWYSNELPSEYQRVEWIGPSIDMDIRYQPYIDIGLTVNSANYNQLRIISETMFLPSATAFRIFGTTNFYVGTNASYLFVINAGSNSFETGRYAVQNAWNEIDVDYANKTYTFNGYSGIIPSIGQYTTSLPYQVFGLATNSIRMVRHRYLKLYIGGVLIRDLVPCYRKADGMKGMFDLISRTPYLNLRTTYSDFAVGEDI